MYKVKKQNSGITLIALVVTIVVLIILATISINLILKEGGIIEKAQQAKEMQANATEHEKEIINEMEEFYGNYIPSEGENPPSAEKVLVTELTEIQDKKVIAEDKKGNQVVVPGGFKVRTDLGETVQDGIVIEDAIGNQFVWIPVSNINADGSNKIIKNNGGEVQITLARYKFTGIEMKQKAGNYTEVIDIEGKQELNIKQESNQSQDTDGTNTTAKDLKKFIDSVNTNKGYYIARYEASFGSGEKSSTITNQKPWTKESSTIGGSSMNYEPGTVWNFITQGNAAKVCRNMYDGDTYVTSDLVNSYAWDTAIMYIQSCSENPSYAYSSGRIYG